MSRTYPPGQEGRHELPPETLNRRGKRCVAHPHSGSAKAQTTMVLILLVILLFAGTAIFLLTFAKSISQTDYMNLYVHNLLLVLMRSDTGYTDPNCKLVSDALSCAFFTPEYVCSGGSGSGAGAGSMGTTCLDLARAAAADYMEKFGTVKKGYRYLFAVEPQGFNVIGSGGEPFRISIGDQGLASERQTKFTANEQIRKATASGVYNLNARLMIMTM